MSTHDLQQQTPSLFDFSPAPSGPEPAGELKEEKGPDRLAKEFVRWCCSFGPEFRNSPDVTNLRYWAHKNKLKIKEREEAQILDSARQLFLKRVEAQTKTIV